MDFFGVLFDVLFGAAIAGIFLRSNEPVSSRALGVRITAYIGMGLTIFMPSIAFMVMGQLLVALFFEIPRIEAQLKDEANG